MSRRARGSCLWLNRSLSPEQRAAGDGPSRLGGRWASGAPRRPLRRAGSGHEQLPAAGRAADRGRLSRRRRVLAHRAARRGAVADRPALARRRSSARSRRCRVCRDKMRGARRHARAADRHRSLPLRRERRRVPRAGARAARPRARDRRSRDRGVPRRRRLRRTRRREAESTVLFDIGGGSSEIVWMSRGAARDGVPRRVEAWESLRLGVVSLAETFGGDDVTPEIFAAMTRHVDEALAPFAGARRRSAALRPLPPARHLGHGDDDRRRASQPAALRPPRDRRAVADAAPKSTRRSRGCAR